MAQALLSVDNAQFSCSICLELLRDPVTIPCGHSYCMSCLTKYWDRQGVCNCPQCRATFSPRPKLGRNNLLVEMMQKLSAVGLTKGPSAPPLYELLAPAEGGFEHPTFDVSSVRPERTDGQRLLGETRRQLAAQIKEREFEVQQLKQSLKSFSHMAKAAVKDSSRIFSELMEFLEHRRVEMKALIRAQEKAELNRAENHLQHLERQISELKRRDTELEGLSHTQDQRLIVQICRSPVPAEASSSLTVSPHVSFGPVRRAISNLKEQLQNLYHTEFPSVTSAVKTVNLLQMEKPNKEVCDAAHVPALDNRADLLQYFCLLSLDPFSAHRELCLTEGNRVVRRTGEIQTYPEHPDRFDSWVQVLCREGLTGRNYWEVEWDGQQMALGLSYENIGRKGSSDHCRLGYNHLSWSLQCSSSSVVFCHEKQKKVVEVPSGSVSRRIGVFLDQDVGLLCFYMVTARGVHLLHRVETKFDMPLYPAMWLGANCTITLCTVN
ncbi:tripartite motif-containing protein 65-like [Stegastes partitus]|uniref:Tripartite motif-containing protein 65-like n=1 Tax=Stegastes partitus TaxID=144197 RepID=A0A9Y4JID5_9TELE|nr:PREDICTED: tripartite motif-containing protein 65-like [Stegastes partitus]XP_008276435.1 PREDICTED: tripartite motif-containing protein 65-like [Stegastes partitus]